MAFSPCFLGDCLITVSHNLSSCSGIGLAFGFGSCGIPLPRLTRQLQRGAFQHGSSWSGVGAGKKFWFMTICHRIALVGVMKV
ncbi:hypothetical protein VTJ04DRAFT_4578 [Mycothermus thermophilus]|uniref:uncharacterized protein n=1 Tax=Humicola insolens TaxID=85995 RepID=UPI003743051F